LRTTGELAVFRHSASEICLYPYSSGKYDKDCTLATEEKVEYRLVIDKVKSIFSFEVLPPAEFNQKQLDSSNEAYLINYERSLAGPIPRTFRQFDA